MALINRITKLFQADIHAVLDNIEEPEFLLKQAIREMQEDIFLSQDQINRIVAEQQKVEANETRLMQSMSKCDQELDLCFESGKHDLARSVIKRRLETEQYCNQLAEKRITLEQSLTELEGRYLENQMRLESMQQKADLFTAESVADPTGPQNNWDIPTTTVSADEIEIAFLSEKQRRK